MGKLRIGVLASGGGTNLQAIIDACAAGDIAGEVVVVISDMPDAYALERGRKSRIPAVAIPTKGLKREEHEKLVHEALTKEMAGLVVLAGYMRVITPWLVGKYENRMMNIHPALLPSFGGSGMYGEKVHKAVLDHGCKVSGCTVHFVSTDVDGGPIILQEPVYVLESDTPESLANRIHPVEHKLYPKAIALFAKGKLQVEGRRVKIGQ